MTIRLHWYLPTSGDGRTISDRAFPELDAKASVGHSPLTGTAAAVARTPDIEYMAQIARSAEQLGFEAVLTPTGVWCEDAWLMSAALARETRRLKFIVAFRPGLTSPVLAAQQASTLQRLSGGRVLLNVVTGGHSDELRRFGDHVPHDERYARCDEFLDIVRGAWDEKPYDFTGTYYNVSGATVFARPDPVPDIYFGGSSAPALEVAARRADVYLSFGEPPPQIAEKIDRVRCLAAGQGRTLRFGMRAHVITRDRSEDAWAAAERLLELADPDEFASAEHTLAVSESVGQRRQQELLASYRRTRDPQDLQVYPGLWGGIGLLRGGAGTAMVGSHAQVADLIEDYADHGVDEFILSGYPHLEEAYWFGEGVLPELHRRGRLGTPEDHGRRPGG
ncbi:MAG TPA: LLM class flavin-dependent oxidoreductase [Streptosporangiaceae bacterium]|nr:LLM class flavin-dependent oxidoreductase [Streptosporangiaceae bacterium]